MACLLQTLGGRSGRPLTHSSYTTNWDTTPDIHERMHRWLLFTERYVLVCPGNHRFRGYEQVPVSDLAQESLLLLDTPDCPVRRFICALCDLSGISPRTRHFADSQEQIIEMVQASLGISVAGECMLVPESLIRCTLSTDADSRFSHADCRRRAAARPHPCSVYEIDAIAGLEPSPNNGPSTRDGQSETPT